LECLADWTGFNHVVEHIAIELLAHTGFDIRDDGASYDSEKDDSKAIIETTVIETTRYLARHEAVPVVGVEEFINAKAHARKDAKLFRQIVNDEKVRL
jgi:hypothetical protein